MGMFDTFYGNINCIDCKKEFVFEEQTKCYECFLQEFLLGDYIDKGNQNYFYFFTTFCPHCKKEQKWAIAIKRGQIVGFYPEDEATLDVLDSLENIEDGYTRNLKYKDMCSKLLGVDKHKKVLKEYSIGEVIEALEVNWIIDEIYKEELEEISEKDALANFYRFRFRDNLVFKVHKEDDSLVERLVILRNGENLRVVLYDFTQKESWEEGDYITRYIAQLGSKLIKIS